MVGPGTAISIDTNYEPKCIRVDVRYPIVHEPRRLDGGRGAEDVAVNGEEARLDDVDVRQVRGGEVCKKFLRVTMLMI